MEVRGGSSIHGMDVVNGVNTLLTEVLYEKFYVLFGILQKQQCSSGVLFIVHTCLRTPQAITSVKEVVVVHI